MTDSKLATIRALLNTAAEDSGGTPAERELAAQRAAELMAKYAVTEAMVDAARNRTDDPIETILIKADNPYALPKAVLLNDLAQHLGCYVIRAQDRKSCHVVGHRSDVDRLEFLYTSLLTQAITMVARVRLHGASPSQVRSYRGNWLLGFSERISERMKEGRAQAVAEATPVAGKGAELVLADRAALVTRHARQQFTKTRKSAARVSNAGGYYAGHAAGDRADLGHARVSGRRAIGA